jgi:hypothetical protein
MKEEKDFQIRVEGGKSYNSFDEYIKDIKNDMHLWNYISIYLERIKEWILSRTFKKSHIVKTKLKPQVWYDKDELILWSCMSLLEDFVEVEKPLEKIDYEGSGPESSHAKDEFMEVYNWWKKRKIVKFDLLNLEEEYKIREEEKKMLIKLIEVRNYLWT